MSRMVRIMLGLHKREGGYDLPGLIMMKETMVLMTSILMQLLSIQCDTVGVAVAVLVVACVVVALKRLFLAFVEITCFATMK